MVINKFPCCKELMEELERGIIYAPKSGIKKWFHSFNVSELGFDYISFGYCPHCGQKMPEYNSKNEDWNGYKK